MIPCNALQGCQPGAEAAAVGEALGIHVLRHTEKKPAGGKEEVEHYFGYVYHVLSVVVD